MACLRKLPALTTEIAVMWKFTHCDHTLKLVYDYECTVNFTLWCYAFCRNFLRASYVRLANVNLIEVDSSLIKLFKFRSQYSSRCSSQVQCGDECTSISHQPYAWKLVHVTFFFASFFMHQLYRICLQDC